MMLVRKDFLGGINSDDAPQLIADSQYLNLVNGSISVSENGRNGRIENVPGTTLIQQQVYPPYGTNRCIGSTVDIERNRIVYAIYNSWGDHGLYCYDIADNVVRAIVYDSQIEGGLGFDSNYLVARNIKVIGDLVIMTDDTNEPRMFNMEAAIKMNDPSYSYDWYYQTISGGLVPIEYESSTVIRRPPIYVLDVVKSQDTSFLANNMRNKAYQFAYRYVTKDNQYSVISAWSQLIPLSAKGSVENCIDVTMPLTEQVPDYVEVVEFIVRFGSNTNRAEVIKRLDKADSDDLAEIISHNDGTVQYTFRYYDNIAGDAVDNFAMATAFDLVPIKAKTLEIARNRLFMGNVLSGYDTPKKTSLSLTPSADSDYELIGEYGTDVFNFVETDAPEEIITLNVTGMAGDFTLGLLDTQLTYNGPNIAGAKISVNLASVWNKSTNVPFTFRMYKNSSEYKSFTFAPYAIPEPNYATQTFIDELDDISLNTGDNIQFKVYLATGLYWDLTFAAQLFIYKQASAVSGGFQAFKTGGTYRASIAFYDRFRRKCGVVEKYVESTIPDRDYSTTNFTTAINWTLVNGSQADLQEEIPDWAYYYQIHITKNLNTRFYVQSRSWGAVYFIKNDAGVLNQNSGPFAKDVYAIGLGLDNLWNYGLGYQFNEGDRIRIYTPSNGTFDLAILGNEGRFLLVEPEDVGSVDALTTAFLFEIYTPYKKIINEPFFETGDMYPVTNPTLSTRQYSTLSGQINGDTYALLRSDVNTIAYIVEAMSPNDSVWQNWETDTGWPTFIDDIGQVRRTHTIVWSNTWIAGTKINALNKFELLSEKATDFQCGEIQKLMLTSKSAEQGTVMLAIGSRQTSSCYLGEVQLVAADKDAFVAQTNQVIGTITTLKGMLGTQHPETAVEYLGLGFWVDANNGAVVQYSANGLDTPSAFKMVRFWNKYLQGYIQMSKTNLDAINGFWQMHIGIDPFKKELFVTLPGLIYDNYATQLPSYSSIPAYASDVNDRFDVADQLAKTVFFDIVGNKWPKVFEFMPEWTDYCENGLYAWKNGALYKHNDDTANWNTFYGTQFPLRICSSWNIQSEPSLIKDIASLVVESNYCPDWAVAMSSYPWIQITDLVANDFKNYEGVFYASWFRDRLSPNTSGTVLDKLYKGDVVKGNAPKIMLEFHQYTSLLYINFVSVGFDVSRGTKELLSK